MGIVIKKIKRNTIYIYFLIYHLSVLNDCTVNRKYDHYWPYNFEYINYVIINRSTNVYSFILKVCLDFLYEGLSYFFFCQNNIKITTIFKSVLIYVHRILMIELHIDSLVMDLPILKDLSNIYTHMSNRLLVVFY